MHAAVAGIILVMHVGKFNNQLLLPMLAVLLLLAQLATVYWLFNFQASIPPEGFHRHYRHLMSSSSSSSSSMIDESDARDVELAVVRD